MGAVQAPRPAFIGLSGAIAAGKSEALAALRRLGAHTLSSDTVVHTLLEDREVARQLAERWGEDVLTNGDLNRERVGAIVFNDPEELAWLESVLHPLVRERVARWRAELPADAEVAVVEVPLLFETGMDAIFDATVVIHASAPLREARATARGTGDLEGRARRQLSEEEKAARATFVVTNDGSLEELEEGLKRLWPQLVAVAGAGG